MSKNVIFAKDFCFDKSFIVEMFNITELIFDKMQLNNKGFPINISYADAYVINTCLYIEIAFKSMILNKGNDVDYQHDLVSLFNLLTSEEKNYIALNTISKYGPTTDCISAFETLLSKEKDNFVEFRYAMFPGKDKYTCCSFLRDVSIVINQMFQI